MASLNFAEGGSGDCVARGADGRLLRVEVEFEQVTINRFGFREPVAVPTSPSLACVEPASCVVPAEIDPHDVRSIAARYGKVCASLVGGGIACWRTDGGAAGIVDPFRDHVPRTLRFDVAR